MNKIVIAAYCLDEAKDIAMNEYGVKIVKNVTQSWKTANSPVGDNEMKQFAVDMFEKNKLTDSTNTGLAIAIIPGSKDTRERPYKFTNIVTEGKRETKRVIEIHLKDSGELIGMADTQGEAIKLAKELMPKYRKDMVGKIVYHVIDDKDLAFELDYAPSASAVLGKYIVFYN